MGIVLASPASATTYLGTSSFDGATVSLSITTDGVTGTPLGTNDITSWDINITDLAGSVDLTLSDSQVLVMGTDLTATPTALSFNFSGDTGLVLFQKTIIGDQGPFYCVDSLGSCWGAGSPAEGASTESGSTQTIEALSQSGTLVLATVSATPLPSTWLMLLSGFVGLGFFAYRGTKTRSAAVASA
jgi:hypothetical protein